jgi:hypothetical protein
MVSGRGVLHIPHETEINGLMKVHVAHAQSLLSSTMARGFIAAAMTAAETTGETDDSSGTAVVTVGGDNCRETKKDKNRTSTGLFLARQNFKVFLHKPYRLFTQLPVEVE